MIEFLGGIVMAVLFFVMSGKLHGAAKAIAICMGLLSIGIGIHGASALFF